MRGNLPGPVTVFEVDADGNVDIRGDVAANNVSVQEYVQLALTLGAPPDEDFDEDAEAGRMKVDPGSNVSEPLLYICTADGWVSK